jgi:nucleoside-diphosphate-sugar epimerase
VVFSTGNVYPLSHISSGGADENTKTGPVGEYAMSCLGRERMFEYAAQAFGTRITIYRLNYAVDLRYGVLFDIAEKVSSNTPVSLQMPVFNCIWQGDAGEIAIRSLLYASSDVFYLNVSGPETASVRAAAEKFGEILGKEPLFCGEPSDTALLSNTGKMARLFGYPSVPLDTMIEWQAQWISSGGRILGKSTHFEERKGDY